MTLRIRERVRRGYIREAQAYGEWAEYQVVDGRKILFRGETLAQAEKFIRGRVDPRGEE
jgi:hypothetical protein